MDFFIVLIIGFIVLILFSIRQVDQYEIGLKFSFGKFTGIMNPGWRIV
ncbi:slipin family protein, partial [bacterium]|nr:slipin family protein [bacterium]